MLDRFIQKGFASIVVDSGNKINEMNGVLMKTNSPPNKCKNEPDSHTRLYKMKRVNIICRILYLMKHFLHKNKPM